MHNKRFILITGLIVIAALIRLLPHPPNFAPIGAMALFGGAYFTRKHWAFIIPMIAMLASDLILGLHGTMAFVYGAFALTVLIGFKLRNHVSLASTAGSALGASLIFFIVTNFGVWLTMGMYPMTLSGLIACYTAAIPFFHYTLIGNLVYAGALFGVMEWMKQRYPTLQPARA